MGSCVSAVVQSRCEVSLSKTVMMTMINNRNVIRVEMDKL